MPCGWGSIGIHPEQGGMQGVARQGKARFQRGSPARANKLQVAARAGGAVEFVADHWMTRVCEMDPDLMGAACKRECPHAGVLDSGAG